MHDPTEVKLELRNISKAFVGVQALDNVSFSLKKGTTHVLCGENGAGKSTLMKIINGVYKQDAGVILIDGKEVNIKNPMDARSHGIAMIHQELSYVPDLTLEENIILGDWPTAKGGMINWKQIRKRTEELLQRENLQYDPTQKLRTMSTSDIQMIEILKAVSNDAQIVIMDEPTSAITDNEVERLFKKIKELNAKGVSVVYISHKLDEVFRIADEISILRDGKLVESRSAGEFDEKSIVEAMVGRKIENQYPKEAVPVGDVLLKVEGLASKMLFKDINFEVRAGEIVGFAGLMGAGRTEVMRAVYGLDRFDEGKVTFQGKEIHNIRQAIQNGVIMLSEDRAREGIIPILSVENNTALASLDRFFRRGKWYKREERSICEEMCGRMRVKTPSMETPIMSLSGGNQQKVLLARWMVRNPAVFILDEPTRGIDVGAKNEIYQLMVQLAKEGKGIIMISSELPELVGMCDRVYVMHEGRITGMLDREECISQDAIMNLAIKSVE